MLTCTCPKCKSRSEFPSSVAGKVVRCSECGTKLRLRTPGESAPEQAKSATPKPARRRRRRPAVPDDELTTTSEWIAPTLILGLGLLLAIGGMAIAKGQAGASESVLQVFVQLIIAVPLSTAGLFIAAPLLGVSFGDIRMAILKLAAINTLTLSIAITAGQGGAHPLLGQVIAAPIGWGLFKWLFDLDFSETLFVLTLIGVMQWIARLSILALEMQARH